jgi:excisionase family DNA binding protein
MQTISSLSHKPLLSVEEVAILLGQSRSSVYRSIERRDLPLPIFKLNGRWRVPRRAVERLLDGDLLVPSSTRQSAELNHPAG